MADPTQVGAAQDQAKQQQAALLQAIAEQGSRGAAMYGQAAAQAQNDRLKAVTTAAHDAIGQGAPEALVAKLQKQAAQPGDERAADVGQAQVSFMQDQARMGDASNNYMNQLSAAVPVVQSRTDATVAALKAQGEQAAAERAIQLQLAQMDLEGKKLTLQGQREANAAASSYGSSGSRAPSTSQQKYDAQQAQHSHQQDVVNMANSADPGTRDAFLAILSNKDNTSLAAALHDLQQGSTPSWSDAWAGSPTGLDQQFPGADPNAIAALLQAFYDSSPQDSGGLSGLGAMPAGGPTLHPTGPR